jgi:hypothetical protein
MASERKKRLATVNYWDELIKLRDVQREQAKNGIQVVEEDELPLENNRMGLIRWYMHPSITDTVLTTLFFFHQEIPPGSRSGRLKFQGGQVMLIIEGKGYTMLDGVKYAWEAGDVLNLPLRANGVIVQHFNSDHEHPAKFVACEPNWFACTSVDRGCGFELIEESPDFRKS